MVGVILGVGVGVGKTQLTRSNIDPFVISIVTPSVLPDSLLYQ